jgi:hypothetical protein
MTSLRFKFAVLKVLAKRPERRMSLDEIRCEIGAHIVNEGPVDQPNCIAVLTDIDIFRSGLLSQDEQGFQITEEGLSLLQTLENSDRPPPATSPARVSEPYLTGLGERSGMFSTELSEAGDGDQKSRQEEGRPTSTSRPEISQTADNHEMNSSPPELTGDNSHQLRLHKGNRETEFEQPSTGLVDAPAFLHRSFGSRTNVPRRPSALSAPFAFITRKRRSVLNVWQHHFSQDGSYPRIERPVGQIGGAAFSLLSLVTVVACIFAAIALSQIGSLKSDIAGLRRELLPLKAGLGKLELAEKVRRESGQNSISKNIGSKESGSDGDTSNAQATLNLSGDEIQLIRDFIKPAPSAGSSAPDIRVGDLIGTTTIPLPSSLTEKIPRLVGARFTTRNGAIVISTKGSLRADVVVPRN